MLMRFFSLLNYRFNTVTHPYGPEQVLVSDEQFDDVGHPRCHGELLLLSDLAPEAFEHEDVGRHHHGDVIQRHLVLFFVVDDPLEELQQPLREKTTSHR